MSTDTIYGENEKLQNEWNETDTKILHELI